MDLRIKLPARILLLGPSMSGKTTWMLNLLKSWEYCFDKPFDKIIFSTGIEQPETEEKLLELVKNKKIPLEIFHRFPETEIEKGKIFEDYKNSLLILDDLASDIAKSKVLIDLFTKISHHKNVSVILSVQTLFWKGEAMKVASRNSSHFALFLAPREGLGISILARQMFPTNSKFMIYAHELATQVPYSCLFVDITPQCPKLCRVRANICRNEDEPYTIFLPSNEEETSIKSLFYPKT